MRKATMLQWNRVAVTVLIGLLLPGHAAAQQSVDELLTIPTLQQFAGGGLGAAAEGAPPELEQFGQLVGFWHVDQEMRRQDGSWMSTAPGVWVWKYALGGYAVQDLWFQSVDNLPIYMAELGHDYALTGLRTYDAPSGGWNIAWAANTGGSGPGADFGMLTGVLEAGDLVLSSPAEGDMPPQRIVFSDIEADSFVWTSSFSRDGGETWMDVMRVTARRLR